MNKSGATFYSRHLFTRRAKAEMKERARSIRKDFEDCKSPQIDKLLVEDAMKKLEDRLLIQLWNGWGH